MASICEADIVLAQQVAMPDPDKAPTCEELDSLTGLVCSNAAVWRQRVLHPDGAHCVTTLACAPHRLQIIAAAERGVRAGRVMKCVLHDVYYVQVLWLAL